MVACSQNGKKLGIS